MKSELPLEKEAGMHIFKAPSVSIFLLFEAGLGWRSQLEICKLVFSEHAHRA